VIGPMLRVETLQNPNMMVELNAIDRIEERHQDITLLLEELVSWSFRGSVWKPL
jgi:hypothetical protein